MNLMDYSLIVWQFCAMHHPEHRGEGFWGQRIVVLPRRVVAEARQKPLLRALLPTDMGVFPSAQDHLRRRELGVDQVIFIYCVRGMGWCEMAGIRHVIHRGELLVVPPHIPHAYGADEQHAWTIYWFHAVGDNVPDYLALLGVTASAPILALGDDARMLALFEEALDVLERGYGGVNLLHASLALAHLMGVIASHRRKVGHGDGSAEDKIKQSMAYMKAHLDRPLRVAALATMANLSSSHYAALFRQQTGHAVMDCFIRLRMQRACHLLDTTTLCVKEIAARLGYDDPFYFSRLFRSVMDLSPTDYRLARKG